MTVKIQKQKQVAIDYALDLGFNEATVHVAWICSKRYVDPWAPTPGRATKMVVADRSGRHATTVVGLVVQNRHVVEEFDPRVDCRNWKRIIAGIIGRFFRSPEDVRVAVLHDHLPPAGYKS